MNTLLAAWLAETALITYRGAKQGGSKENPVAHLPLPSEYVASFVVFGALSLVPGPNGQRVAGLFGWGVVVATFLNLWNPKGGIRQLRPGKAYPGNTYLTQQGTMATFRPGSSTTPTGATTGTQAA